MVNDAVTISERTIARFKKERRGTGEGRFYVPGRTLREMPTVGRTYRFSCSRCGGRQIVLPSDIALAAFLEEHWAASTCDVKPFVPLLDVDRTVSIGKQLGVKHPLFKDGSPRILFTDLMVCKREWGKYVWTAVEIVSVRSGTRKATIENQIKAEFWREACISSRVAHSSGLDTHRSINLWLLFGFAEQINAFGVGDRECLVHRAILHRLLANRADWLSDIRDAVARDLGLTQAECTRGVLQLIATRTIECSLDVPRLLAQSARNICARDWTIALAAAKK